MAHGVSEVLGEGSSVVKMVKHQSPQRQQQLQHSQQQHRSVMGSRRIFPPQFKVKVLDSYRNDEDCKLNQRATARKFNIHRRQIQKWLQNEKTLRDSCPDSGSSSSSGCSSGTASAVTTPAASPPQDLLLLQQQQSQQHHHHNHHQQSSEPTSASPALNLSLARLHGDELAVQPPPPPQQQPPPPPLQSSSGSGSSAVAAQALAAATAAAHQHQQAPDYRFRVSPTAIALAAAAAAAAAATGYPDFKDGLPIARQPPPPTAPSASSHHHHQQHHFVPTAAAAAAGVHRQPGNYPMLEQLYQPPPQLVYNPHREQQPLSPPITPHHRYEPLDIHQPRYHFTKAIEPKLDSSLSSPSSSSSPASLGSLNPEDELQLRRRASLISPVKIKTERASPDSLALTPGPCESSSSSIISHISSTSSPGAVSPSGASSISSIQEACSHLSRLCNLKRELPDEEEEHHRRRTSSLSESCSPAPSQPDHLENLPPSPDRSNASSDSEMEQSPGGGSDLARRRSFSLRFKLDVLDAFHRDKAVAGNQRATARKFGINRRQVQKWLGQESELRGVIELCGSDNRQRLGPAQEPEESAVDLRTSLTEASPPHSGLLGAGYNCCEYRLGSASPGTAYLDSSLTPPYSTPGCSLSCCSQDAPVQPSYYCYSPGEIADSTASSLKRAALCSQSCCYPPAKRPCIEEIKPAAKDDEQQSEPEQDSPLCLVKPKPDSTGSSSQQQQEPVSSTVPSPPASATPVPTPLATKKDPILFKPYLDNPVSKPSAEESAINNNNNNNNNCQTVCNLNEQRPVQDLELELKFKLPAKWRAQQQQLQPQQPAYLEAAPVRSAFVRYPSSVHYS